MPKKLVIIDEHIQTKSGHYYTYNKSVMSAFAANGFTSKLYGGTNLLPEICEELNGIAHFKYDAQPWYRKIPVLGALLYRRQFWKVLQQQIEAAIAQENDSDTIFFFPNIYWYNIVPVTKAIRNCNRQVSLLFRNSLFEFTTEPKPFHKLLKQLVQNNIKKLAANPNVQFTTDSEVISTEFAQLGYKQIMKVLPIPHCNDVQAARENTEQITCYVPGVLRMEKGASFLLSGMQQFCIDYPEWAEKVCLHTQFFGEREKRQLEQIKKGLQQLNIKNKFSGSLSSADYEASLANSSIIIICYDPECGYRARTSGVLSEAIAAGKPFITSDDTWMSVQAKQYNVGKTVAYGNTKQFADALAALCQNLKVETEKVAAVQQQWASFHSEKNFYAVYTK